VLVLGLVNVYASSWLIRRVLKRHSWILRVCSEGRFSHTVPRIGLRWLHDMQSGLGLCAKSSMATLIELILMPWWLRWGA